MSPEPDIFLFGLVDTRLFEIVISCRIMFFGDIAVFNQLFHNICVLPESIRLVKGKALRKQSLHEKTAASVLLKLFISGNEWCHTTTFVNSNSVKLMFMQCLYRLVCLGVYIFFKEVFIFCPFFRWKIDENMSKVLDNTRNHRWWIRNITKTRGTIKTYHH